MVLSLSLWVATDTVEAATYYVSPAGSDLSSGSVSAPFKTVQRAADMVNPGDTVIVKDGTYTDTNADHIVVSLNRGGRSREWITFQAENIRGAVLDCRNNTTDYGWSNLPNAHYVTIQGFEIKGCAKMGINSNSGSSNHDINIYKNYIHHIGRKATNSVYGLVGVFAGKGTYNITIDGNLLHDIGRLNPYTDPSAAESTCTTGKGTVICYSNDHGIYLYGRSHTVINNVFEEMQSGWAVQIGGGPSPDGADWKIINNTFYGKNSQRDGNIMIWKAPGGVMPTQVLIENNITCGARNTFITRAGSITGSTTWQVKNNLVYGATAIGSPGMTFTSSGNIIGQDPKFRDLTHRDFPLQADPPGRGDGNAHIAPGADYDNKKMPPARDCSRGAYGH